METIKDIFEAQKFVTFFSGILLEVMMGGERFWALLIMKFQNTLDWHLVGFLSS